MPSTPPFFETDLRIESNVRSLGSLSLLSLQCCQCHDHIGCNVIYGVFIPSTGATAKSHEKLGVNDCVVFGLSRHFP